MRIKGVAAALATGMCIVAQAVPAQAQQREFNIPAGSLRSTLDAYGRQSGRPIIYRTEEVRGVRSSGYRGSASPEDALSAILAGTGYAARTDSSGAIAIFRVISDGGSVPRGGAQVSGGPGSQADRAASSGDTISADDQDIVITGTSIRGSRPVGSPLNVYDRKEIGQSGSGTIADFARRMPENFASIDATLPGTSTGGFNQAGNNGSFGSGFNLRGIGPSATLTLLNGHRLSPAGSTGEFADISMIPLGAVERIEVLGDGASAIYGADAVAGVVNVVLRRRYTGLESSIRYSDTTDGGRQTIIAGQLGGVAWQTGSLLLAYEYERSQELRADQRSFVAPQGGPLSLYPRQNRHSLFGALRQDLSSSVSLSADGYFTRRSFFQLLTPFGASSGGALDGQPTQAGGNVELAVDIGLRWQVRALAGLSRLSQPATNEQPTFTSLTDYDSELFTIGIRADGPLVHLPGGDVRLAVGGERRAETFEAFSSQLTGGITRIVQDLNLRRRVHSAYGELVIPVVGSPNATAGIRELNLSIAGRYDHYSDFGDAFSPKFGMDWAPVAGVRLRGSIARSFKAPLLTQLASTPNFFVFRFNDPSAPDGITVTLQNNSTGNPDLRPERSRTFALGADIDPVVIPNLRLSATYWNLSYDGRIGTPPRTGGLLGLYTVPGQKALLAPFITEPADPAFIQSIYASGILTNPQGIQAAAVEAYFDARPQNIASTSQSGIEIAARYILPVPDGSITFSSAWNYMLRYDFRPTSTSPSAELLGRLGQPVRVRSRSTLFWSGDVANIGLSFNHWGRSTNPLFVPAEPIRSHGTLDFHFGITPPPSSIFRGFEFALDVQNLADRNPPPVNVPAGIIGNLGYDPANATPLGRVIALSLRKRW